MSVWLVFCLICVIYFERKTIDQIGEKLWARLIFEWNYHSIRRSIKKEERKWS